MITSDSIEAHPGWQLTVNMMKASKLRDTLYRSLAERKVKRLREYRLMVDFAIMPESMLVYSYCLRVFPVGSKAPVLERWSEASDGIVDDETMALLLVLFNS